MKITFKKERGQLIPYSDDDENAVNKLKDGIYTVDMKNMDMRTVLQNAALHKWFSMVSEALNDRGLSKVKVLKVDVMWSPGGVKEDLWKPIQKAVLDKKSTTKLNKDEIDSVYDTLNSALAMRFGISLPFPSREE